MTDIRLSPTGPVIKNSGGAPFTPGSGMRLRLSEAASTAGVVNIPTVPVDINTLLLAPATLGLSSPNPNYKYRGQVMCDVSNPTTNVVMQCELYYDLSSDNGVTWVNYASNTHQVGFSSKRQITLNLPLKAGSLYGVTAGQASLLERVRIGASVGGTSLSLLSEGTPGGGPGVGTYNVQLEETF
jgi:hypothetical protein